MYRRFAATMAAGLLLATLFGGCYQSPAITLHEAGDYQGSPDPLRSRLKNFELQKELEKRLMQVQTDR